LREVAFTVFRVIRRGIVLGSLVALFVVAGSAAAATLRGVVVHRNQRAHSFVIALRGGRLAAAHAGASPSIGRTARVSVRRLRNGTYAALHIAVGHRARRARIRGVVTFVDRRHGLFTVSADGASMLVLRPHDAAAAQALPAVSDDVTVEVEIDDQGDLLDESLQLTGSQTSNIDLEGTILAIDATARTLTISADDDEQSGRSLTVDVPSTIDISMFSVGQEVELTVTKQPDGTFLLQGGSGDDNAQRANNPEDETGCSEDDSNKGQSGRRFRAHARTAPPPAPREAAETDA
jgi:hypothetical protein